MTIKEPHTMNGQHKEKKVTVLSMFNTVKRMNIAQISMLISIILACFAGFGFVKNTQSSNKDIPAIKQTIEEHEKNDIAKDFVFMNTLNEIKISMSKVENKIDLVNQKVDDMKAYGVGEYHRKTKEAIRKAE